MERRMTLDERLNQLRHDLDERIDQAITDNVNEISEAVGRVYDEYPRDLSDDEERYTRASGAREALHSVLKELDIDPESVRKGWE